MIIPSSPRRTYREPQFNRVSHFSLSVSLQRLCVASGQQISCVAVVTLVLCALSLSLSPSLSLLQARHTSLTSPQYSSMSRLVLAARRLSGVPQLQRSIVQPQALPYLLQRRTLLKWFSTSGAQGERNGQGGGGGGGGEEEGKGREATEGEAERRVKERAKKQVLPLSSSLFLSPSLSLIVLQCRLLYAAFAVDSDTELSASLSVARGESCRPLCLLTLSCTLSFSFSFSLCCSLLLLLSSPLFYSILSLSSSSSFSSSLLYSSHHCTRLRRFNLTSPFLSPPPFSPLFSSSLGGQDEGRAGRGRCRRRCAEEGGRRGGEPPRGCAEGGAGRGRRVQGVSTTLCERASGCVLMCVRVCVRVCACARVCV